MELRSNVFCCGCNAIGADHPVANLHRWRSFQYLWVTTFLDIIHALHHKSSDEAFMKTHAAYEKLMKHVVTSSVGDGEHPTSICLYTARALWQHAGGAAGECNLQDGIVASTMLVGDLADTLSQHAGGAAGECNLQDGIVASTMLVGDLADIMTVRLEDAVSCCPERDRPLEHRWDACWLCDLTVIYCSYSEHSTCTPREPTVCHPTGCVICSIS